jgi:hypothetical protein
MSDAANTPASADVDTPGGNPPRRTRTSKRRALIAGITGAGLLVAGFLLLRGCGESQPQTVRAVAVGDMVCDPSDPGVDSETDCKSQEVSDIAVGLNPDAFLGLGDYVYEVPKTDTYNTVYAPSWGRLRDITLPALGNQEYKVHKANTFRTYFGERSGPDAGYWSTEFGQWHVVVLNTNCTVVVGGCAEGSPQQKWLAEDLASHPAQCTVVLMHHPRWSTGLGGPDGRLQDMFATMVDNKVELVLSGHEAHYERFGTLDADGAPTPEGTRQFVVGTGGQVVYEPGEGDAPWRNKGNMVKSEFVDFTQHGVLELTLAPDSYDWAFHSLDNGVTDSGSAPCH